ncbi:transcription repressor OFP14-like [Miscanthus floridulus]|uniref:transcription repressor OFP14-like n=1 Tax=Miscanthus floridulus TaxID=154761 RepID=UPI0034587EE1
MATRWQRCAQQLSSHPYHSAISSSPSFSLGARGDDDHDGDYAAAGNSLAPHDGGGGGVADALASPRMPGELPPGAVSASDRFFVSPAPTASLVDDDAAAGEALRGAAVLVETYSSDPRAEFLESMADMAAACGAEGMPEPEYREFMEELLSCYLDRNDRGVHRHVLAAFDDLTARRWPHKRRRPILGLMKMNPCVSGRW